MYCSAATRQILLRLEKYHHRINFAKGVLERRNVTYDRSMRKLAKPLPLDTPTVIELAPGNTLRVTLIDANHCIGAVMFLIEGNGTAILYTGDIRAETWWLNSLVQNPVLLPYTLGIRRLDCVYLDTTFATKSEPYRDFPSKAEGIQELFEKVSQYPDDTVFYFHSWTFGYEKVWVALSAFLKSRIHLDDYRARIYGSLSTLTNSQLREIGLCVPADNKFVREYGLEIREAPVLCGFKNGNHIQPGCLTSKEGVRIHSCERGTGCRVMDRDTDSKVVHIIPIITRAGGEEIAELGAGGGNGDLDQREQLVASDLTDISDMVNLYATSVDDRKLPLSFPALLKQALIDGNGKLDIDKELQEGNHEAISLESLVSILSSRIPKNRDSRSSQGRTIRFPYSRHSSYTELCKLIEALNPADVIPCTVDEDNWTPAISMRNLFGELCSSHVFRHDTEMMQLYETKLANRTSEKREFEDTQENTQTTSESLIATPAVSKRIRRDNSATKHISTEDLESPSVVTPPKMIDGISEDVFDKGNTHIQRISTTSSEVGVDFPAKALSSSKIIITDPDHSLQPSIRLTTSLAPLPPAPISCTGSEVDGIPKSYGRKQEMRFNNRRLAYHAAIGTYLTWSDYGGLVSARSKADRDEQEL